MEQVEQLKDIIPDFILKLYHILEVFSKSNLETII